MSEFDDHDLGRRLRAAAGSEPDVAHAHQVVRRRVVRARRRRVAVFSGTAAILVVTVGALAAARDRGEGQLRTAESSIVAPPDNTDTLTTDSAPAQTTPDGSSTSSVPAPRTTIAEQATTTSTTDTSAPNAPVLPPSSDPSTSSPAGPSPTTVSTSPGDVPTVPSTAPTTPTTPTTAAPTSQGPQTFFAEGGSIRVQLIDGALDLIDWTPAVGYSLDEKHEAPDEVEVKFVSATSESSIRVRVVDGQMQQSHEQDDGGTESEDK